jgi:hypothetical protein
MISAHLKSPPPGENPMVMLALTLKERNALRCLLDRVIDDVAEDKKRYATPQGSPHHGRLVRDGHDITMMTFELERWAREFLRRL